MTCMGLAGELVSNGASTETLLLDEVRALHGLRAGVFVVCCNR
jgi:hypothetical protein